MIRHIGRVGTPWQSSAEAAKAKETMAAEAAKSHMVNFSVSKNEVIENAFKAESVGLQTREQFSEKRTSQNPKPEDPSNLKTQSTLEILNPAPKP
jgi:protein FAM50